MKVFILEFHGGVYSDAWSEIVGAFSSYESASKVAGEIIKEVDNLNTLWKKIPQFNYNKISYRSGQYGTGLERQAAWAEHTESLEYVNSTKAYNEALELFKSKYKIFHLNLSDEYSIIDLEVDQLINAPIVQRQD